MFSFSLPVNQKCQYFHSSIALHIDIHSMLHQIDSCGGTEKNKVTIPSTHNPDSFPKTFQEIVLHELHLL